MTDELVEKLRQENAEIRRERDALLEKPISLAKMDSIDDDATDKMIAYYWHQQAQQARAALTAIEPSVPAWELVERLRAIDEEAMYQAPATTHRTINEAAAEIERLTRLPTEPEPTVPPEQATAAMVDAALDSWYSSTGDDRGRMFNALDAALAASPEPPTIPPGANP